MKKSLTAETLSGINWTITKTYVKAFVSAIVGIILARILPPSEFGLLGMTVIFIGIADLFATLGINSAVVKIKEINKYHLNGARLSILLLGFIMFFFFYLTAPYIADFYNEPKLTDILKVLSIPFILKGITSVSTALIMRRMDFRLLLIIELSAYVGGYTVGIIFALYDYGVWSLVIARILSSIIATIIIFINEPPKFGIRFRKEELKELFAFGTGLSLSKLLHYAATNVDYLIIGKFLSPYLLGLYQKSYSLFTLPIQQVSSGIYSVLFPAFSKVQDNPEKLRIGYLRTIQTVVFILFPILTFLFISGKFVILGLYGPNWKGAVTVFKILVLAGYFRATLSYSGAIAHAVGKVYVELRQQIVYFITLAVGVYFGVEFGIEGAAVAVVFALFVLFMLQSQLAIQIIETNWLSFLKTFLPGITLSIIIFLFNITIIMGFEVIPPLPYPIKLLILSSVTIVTFVVCAMGLPVSLKGDTVDWILRKYIHKLPKFVKKIIIKFYKTY